MKETYNTISVNPVSRFVGAEINNVDIAEELSNEQFLEIRQAFVAHGVIFIRDQNLTPDQHIEFAKRWGEVNVNRFFQLVDTHPTIAEVLKESNQKSNIGSTWHTDHSYNLVPAMGAILYACEVPKIGGDTLF